MKFTSGPLFATLALTAYLPCILAAQGFAPSSRSVAVFRRGELASNGTAVANGTEVADAGQAEDENKDGEDVDENADEENQDDNQNEDENLQEELDNLNGINIDPNDLEGSLESNIGNLMLGLGICNFDIGSIGGIGINNQIQLLLQLQQLQQLQQLGLVNSFSIQQLLQQELLLGQFNLNIFKRTISATIKQAARANKRTVMTKRECKGQNKAKSN